MLTTVIVEATERIGNNIYSAREATPLVTARPNVATVIEGMGASCRLKVRVKIAKDSPLSQEIAEAVVKHNEKIRSR